MKPRWRDMPYLRPTQTLRQEQCGGLAEGLYISVVLATAALLSSFVLTSALSLFDEKDDLAAIRSSVSSISSRVTPGPGLKSGSVADITRSTDEAKSVPSRPLRLCSPFKRAVPRPSACLMIGSRRLSWSSKTRSALRSRKRQDKKAAAF